MRITMFLLLLTHTALAQWGSDGFNAGQIIAEIECQELKITQTEPPAPRPGYTIHSCRIEAVWKGSMEILGDGCDTLHTYSLPSDTGYVIRRRVFWKGSSGTFWKLTPSVLPDPVGCPVDQYPPDEVQNSYHFSGTSIMITGTGTIVIIDPVTMTPTQLIDFEEYTELNTESLGPAYIYIVFQEPYEQIVIGLID